MEPQKFSGYNKIRIPLPFLAATSTLAKVKKCAIGLGAAGMLSSTWTPKLQVPWGKKIARFSPGLVVQLTSLPSDINYFLVRFSEDVTDLYPTTLIFQLHCCAVGKMPLHSHKL